MKVKQFYNLIIYKEDRKEDYLLSNMLNLYPYRDIQFNYEEFQKKVIGKSSRFIYLIPINITVKI